VLPLQALAQQPVTITGRVTNEAGAPLPGASVSIDVLNVGANVGPDGSFTLTIPASRVQEGRQVSLTARSVGFSSQTVGVTLTPGATLTQNFRLGTEAIQLEGIIATGQGTEATQRQVGATISTVREQEIRESNEPNIVNALAAKAPGVTVTSTSGDPGAGSFIKIRGVSTIYGNAQPLFVVDGVPIDNSVTTTYYDAGGPAEQNRAGDINPSDIERVEILKGPAATALYGSRASSGVVVITTKSGTAGVSRASFRSSYSNDQVNKFIPLQRSYGRGLADPDNPTVNLSPDASNSYGPRLACAPNCVVGTDVFDHAREMYNGGSRFENDLTLSGGSGATTYYLSAGKLNQDGVLVGNNSRYDRTSVRLKASHGFRDDLTVSGNVNYISTGGAFASQGNTVSSILLGAVRGPPEFNNLPYLDPATGLHRSYRCNELAPACPAGGNFFDLNATRGYDNPFWVANRITNVADVERTVGNILADYRPLDWLTLSYNLGVDYSSDTRTNVVPKTSSDYPQGRLNRGDIAVRQWDSNLLATLTHSLNDDIGATLTLGQNLNQRDYGYTIVDGYDLVYGQDQLDFTVDRQPNEYRERVRTDGYFAQARIDFWNQLFLTGAVRRDGSSTFGGDNHFTYPKLEGAWTFSDAFTAPSWVDFLKLRGSWGVTGTQPPAFTNTFGFERNTFTEGFTNGLESTYRGFNGAVFTAIQSNPDIRPEKTTGFDTGLDVSLIGGRLTGSLTHYTQKTKDVILNVSVPPSTGFTSRWENAARIKNDGWEAALGITPVQMQSFSWELTGQYAKNNSCVEDLSGTDQVVLNSFNGPYISVVAPVRSEAGKITKCYGYGVLYGDDFVRFGRGVISDEGTDIDTAFPNTPEGTLYVGEDGFPQYDPQNRVIGDPNPDWTGSIRSTFTFFNNVRISGLLDIKHGGDIWNGTRGALEYFGTAASSERFHGAGSDTIFPGVGPGAGETVRLNWDTWSVGGIGNSFVGPSSSVVEDGGYVKLRDVTVQYSLTQPFVQRVGLSSIDLAVSGRNLKTWTDYSGVDPETNIFQATAAQGFDYFTNPQTRSWVFTVQINR
jgi:TonB-linked SusC/RagA family outer membrane protein